MHKDLEFPPPRILNGKEFGIISIIPIRSPPIFTAVDGFEVFIYIHTKDLSPPLVTIEI